MPNRKQTKTLTVKIETQSLKSSEKGPHQRKKRKTAGKLLEAQLFKKKK
jgi:hypothetical protein